MTGFSATIVADLGFGDAGKGTMIDYLAREAQTPTVIRFNGGAQAAHNVVTPDGRHHTFSQFGSGMLVPDTRTHLSRYMLVDPIELAEEASRLRSVGCMNAFMRLTIDEQALLVTPFHKSANRLRERHRGAGHHGTCGKGIGETMADSLTQDDVVYAGDLRDVKRLERLFASIQERKRDELRTSGALGSGPGLPEDVRTLEDRAFASEVAQAIHAFATRLQIVTGDFLKASARKGDLLFEGAQGVLLDEWYGFHPHTTWSTTTFANAEDLLRDADYDGRVSRLGVLRAYHTRHGAGPFVTHDAHLTRLLADPHNGSEGWQGEFRVGWFDFVMARYALEVCQGADALAITHLDRFGELTSPVTCSAYRHGSYGTIEQLVVKTVQTDLEYQERLTGFLNLAVPIYDEAPKDPNEYLRLIADTLKTPVTFVSRGPKATDKEAFVS